MRKCTMIIVLAILALALTAPGAWSTERDPSDPGPQTSGDDGGWNDVEWASDDSGWDVPVDVSRDPRSVRPWRYDGDDGGWDDPSEAARDPRSVRPYRYDGDDSGWGDPHSPDDIGIDDPATKWGPGLVWSIWIVIERAIDGAMVP